MASDLETVDFDGVEILAAGGPYHGKGSPPEGDYFTSDDLRAMATNATALASELHPTVAVNPPPNKIGHIEQPAVGYLENQRLDKTGTRLLADVKGVPKKLASLIRAGAYRARSVDLKKVTSQETGEPHEMVVTGLAWLGARLPAVRTLDDVVALYEGDGEIEEYRVLEFAAAGDIVWDPENGACDLMEDVGEALNGASANPQYWVQDVSMDGRAALVVSSSDSDSAWVVPITVGPDGDPVISPQSEWVAAEQTWIAAAKNFQDATPGIFRAPADTRPKMADLVLTDEAQRALGASLGIEGDISAESLLTAAKAKAETPASPTGDVALREMAEETKTQLETTRRELADERKKTFIEKSLTDGRFEPGQREHFERQFDADEKSTRAYVATLPKNEDLAHEYGSDEHTAEETEETRQLEDEQSKRVISSLTGIPLEEVS